MKTTHQKFHPTATPPEGAVYIGSIEAAWKCDLYLSGDDVHQFLSPTERARHRVECIQEANESGHEWYIAASSLIRDYREKQSTPTPMTREVIIETLARAGYDYLRATGAFDRLSIEGREKILGAAEAQAIAIGVVKLAPAPAPEPVKKLPTAEQFLSELAYEGRIRGLEAASWDEIQEKFQRDDARDRQHAPGLPRPR